MRPTLLLLALAACGLALAPAAAAQETAEALPTCASQGVQRVAVMVPPGQTEAQLREALRAGSFFPAGTEVRVLRPGQLTPLRNQEQFSARLNTSLTVLLNDGVFVQGTAPMLVEVDEDGAVTDVHPNSGNADLDRLLARTWRVAHFEPYVFGGCRVKAWVQVPQTFSTDSDSQRRQMEVRTAPAPLP